MASRGACRVGSSPRKGHISSSLRGVGKLAQFGICVLVALGFLGAASGQLVANPPLKAEDKSTSNGFSFRYGTMTWVRDASTADVYGVEFQIQLAVKYDFIWGSEPNVKFAPDGSLYLAGVSGASTNADSNAPLPAEGWKMKFLPKTLSADGICADPLDLTGSTGCTPWTQVYGMFADQDNTPLDVEMTVDWVDPDTDNLIGDLIVGRSYIKHSYATATYATDTPFLAFFTGGDKSFSVKNNPYGRFRLETIIDLTTENRPPSLSMIPVLPVPRSIMGDAPIFQVPAYDLDDAGLFDTAFMNLRLGEENAALGIHELGGVMNWKVGDSTQSPQISDRTGTLDTTFIPTQPTGVVVVNSRLGLFQWRNAETLAEGLYNMVVVAEDQYSSVMADFSLYLYDLVKFCHADCAKPPARGASTFADPDGIYGMDGGCNICNNGIDPEDFTVCTPLDPP
eukprot:CAMPEP_0182874048 /NCGR_PEP_ID=MMETSP0034_2-20130328/12699_1 /TAXON_ID=156128 /ORGANISM="Nephroselmis pyriformis, Strain CCMP717" /LENGTH=452 /DNA_ID=CAMNT_0025006741 /DNA_START=198 /DNA_END=1553 /DNA_ORIENTATION=-